MSADKSKMNINTSFLNMNPEKQDVSRKVEDFSNTSTDGHHHDLELNPDRPLKHRESHSTLSTPTGVQVTTRESILSLGLGLLPLSPFQALASCEFGTPTHENSTRGISSSESNGISFGETTKPVVEVTNHTNEVEVTDTFYEDTTEFDRRLLGESFFLDNSSTISTIDTVSFTRNTGSFDSSFFRFTSTSEARNVEASLAIPTTVHNQELIDWAHRYDIPTSSECFVDLLKVVHNQEDKVLSVNNDQRGTKRTAPAEFPNPPAKAICREVPRQLNAAPKRRDGKVDLRLWRRVVQKSVTPIILGAKTAWVQVRWAK